MTATELDAARESFERECKAKRLLLYIVRDEINKRNTAFQRALSDPGEYLPDYAEDVANGKNLEDFVSRLLALWEKTYDE